MSKRTQGTVRVVLDVDYDVGTQGAEAEMFECGTVQLAVQEAGRWDLPIPEETVREVAAAVIDVLVQTHDDQPQCQSAMVRLLRVRRVK